MIKGKTSSGFEWEVDDDVKDDYELIELFQTADEGSAKALTDAYKRILGEEQYKKMKEFMRNDKGRVPASKMLAAMNEIVNSLGDDIKN